MVNSIKILNRDYPLGFQRIEHTLAGLWKENIFSYIQRPSYRLGTLPQKGGLWHERTFPPQRFACCHPRSGLNNDHLVDLVLTEPSFGCIRGQIHLWISFFSFQNAVSKYGSQFQGNSQHDALEFLLWLLDRVHEDLEGSSRGPVLEKVGHSQNNPMYWVFFFSSKY